ncbi:MAG: hypothetical protein WCM93_02215 [Bacteroidota bacterium]
MKKHLFILLVIQFIIMQSAFCQTDSILNEKEKTRLDSIYDNIYHNPLGLPDTLRFDAIEIAELDSNFEKMLKWHQLVTKKEKRNKSNKNTLDIISIQPTISRWSGVPKRIIDSLYAKNDFPIESSSPSYEVSIYTADCTNIYIRKILCSFKKYYVNYQGRDVFIVSDLDIKFPNNKGGKSFSYVITENNYNENLFTRYYFYYSATSQIITKKITNNDNTAQKVKH